MGTELSRRTGCPGAQVARLPAEGTAHMVTPARIRRAALTLLLGAATTLGFCAPALGAPALARADGAFTATVITSGLNVPWDIAFLPDGRALVTERGGAVRIVDADGRVSPTPACTQTVSQNGEGGLLGIALDPAFAAGQPFVYLVADVGNEMQVQRWRFANDRLQRDGTVIGGITMGTIHSSGRVRFGPDGAMYVGTGDAGEGWRSQSAAVANGKVLRVAPGAFRGATVSPTFYANGLRNPQGFAWQPGTGLFFSTDHGPSGFDGPSGDDELNVIVQGDNYGWPFVRGADHGFYTAPVHVWATTIAPSGLSFVTLPGSTWTGRAIVAGLKGKVLRLLTLDGPRVIADEPLLLNAYGRLRAVTEAPDGAIWVTTSNRDGRGTPIAGDDRIIRIVPPAGTPYVPSPSAPLEVTTPSPSAPGAPTPAAGPGRNPSTPLVIRSLVAPAEAGVGQPVHIRLRFWGVPAGRVSLERRLARGWFTLRTAGSRSDTVTFAYRPSTAGRQTLRLTYRSAGRVVRRTTVIAVHS